MAAKSRQAAHRAHGLRVGAERSMARHDLRGARQVLLEEYHKGPGPMVDGMDIGWGGQLVSFPVGQNPN